MFRLVLVACAVLFLAACSSGGDKISGPAVPGAAPSDGGNGDPGGGGNGSGDPTLPVVDPDSARSLTGMGRPTWSHRATPVIMNDIVYWSDSMTISHVEVLDEIGGRSRSNTSCGRTVCVTGLGDNAHSPALEEIQASGLHPGLQYSRVGQKYGARVLQAQGHTVFASFPADSMNYGAWLDYSGFWTSLETIRSGNLGSLDLAGWQIGYGTSIGNDTGTRPTGNATWRGIMVGGTSFNGPLQTIQGDASLSYDVGRNELDVAFTNVWNLHTKAFYSSFRNWSDVPVRADGSFRQGTGMSATKIEGRFYGPGHAEVGGTFFHPLAFGAFGAKRQ